MGSPFANAIAAGLRSINRLAGVAVTFHRGATSVSLTATPGSSDLETTNVDDNVAIHSRTFDWIVSVDELGALFPPKPGDLLKRVVGTKRITFQAMEPAYHPSDHDETRVRLHTQRISREDI